MKLRKEKRKTLRPPDLPPPKRPFLLGFKPYETEAADAEEVLKRARAALSPRGAWIKGTATRAPGGRCLSQVLRDVNGKAVGEAERIVCEAIQEFFPGRSLTAKIPKFNDHSKTTKIDVLFVLDAAIERAQKEKEAKQ